MAANQRALEIASRRLDTSIMPLSCFGNLLADKQYGTTALSCVKYATHLLLQLAYDTISFRPILAALFVSRCPHVLTATTLIETISHELSLSPAIPPGEFQRPEGRPLILHLS